MVVGVLWSVNGCFASKQGSARENGGAVRPAEHGGSRGCSTEVGRCRMTACGGAGCGSGAVFSQAAVCFVGDALFGEVLLFVQAVRFVEGVPFAQVGGRESSRRARHFSLSRQRKVPQRKATRLAASLRFAAGNLRCSRPAGSCSNSPSAQTVASPFPLAAALLGAARRGGGESQEVKTRNPETPTANFKQPCRPTRPSAGSIPPLPLHPKRPTVQVHCYDFPRSLPCHPPSHPTGAPHGPHGLHPQTVH